MFWALDCEDGAHQVIVYEALLSLCSRGAGRSASAFTIVDDSVDGAEMLAAALNAKGYDTRVAHDAPVALQLAEDFRPDVALLDIGLPVMDGYELAARLRDCQTWTASS